MRLQLSFRVHVQIPSSQNAISFGGLQRNMNEPEGLFDTTATTSTVLTDTADGATTSVAATEPRNGDALTSNTIVTAHLQDVLVEDVIEEETATTITTTNHNDDIPIVDMKDVWATSEGYTPLQDFTLLHASQHNNNNNNFSHRKEDNDNNDDDDEPSNTSIGMYFSTGVDGETMYTSTPGAFYANIASMTSPPPNHDWDDDGNDDEDDEDEAADVNHEYNYLHNHDDDDDDDDDDIEATTNTTVTTSSTSYWNDSMGQDDYRSVAENALLALDREYDTILAYESRNTQCASTTAMSPASITYPDAFLSSEMDLTELNIDPESDMDTKQPSLDSAPASSTMVDDTSFLIPPPTQQEVVHCPKVIPNIDTAAVRRVVQTIQLQNPKLEHNLRVWERMKQLHPPPPPPYLATTTTPTSTLYQPTTPGNTGGRTVMAPQLHPIIPETPLRAFRKRTVTKAIHATSNLTRAACIAEAVHRFNLLQFHIEHEQTIRIHILGCDHVEIGLDHSTNASKTDTSITNQSDTLQYGCCDVDRIRTLFGPIVRWMGAYPEAPTHIRIELIGPNISKKVETSTRTTPIDLMPTNRTLIKECLQSATLRCHSGTYEDIHQQQDAVSDIGQPDLAIAFNAGIWGYEEWIPTIRYMIQQPHTIPFVVTAYTFEEAEDDYDTIAEVIKQCSAEHNQVKCEWDVEHDPYASNQEQATKVNKTGSSRRENAAWQAWRL
jgi:hypothetical protein